MDARIQQLRSNLARCLQNGRTIAAYYWSLKETQDELYKYTPLPNCSCGHCKCDCGSIMAKQREEEKTHQLLMGLDDVFFKLRSKMLALHPLPPLNRVYELLLQEEHQIKEERRLPRDLLTEILSRLPVKSLVRFRCVEKSWLSLVDEDREFARLHLKAFKNNRDETHLLFVHRDFYYRDIGFVVHCTDTFEAIMKTSSSHLEMETGLPGWYPVSYLDGLILLESYRTEGNPMKLWNPSLGKFRDIPPLPITGYILKETSLGLGYDPMAKDYNLVKLIFADTTEVPILLHSVAIYTVGVGSWKFIPFEGKGRLYLSNWRWKCSPITTVYLQGSLYLSVRDAYNDSVEDLLSFDLSKKVFSLVGVPNDPDLKRKRLVLINGGSSMAFFEDYSRDKTVWIFESKSMKWTKHCSYTLKYTKLLYGKKNGDTILSDLRTTPNDQVMSYNPKKQQCKILQQEIKYNEYFCIYVSAYKESLILP